jgi:hypothetical protein
MPSSADWIYYLIYFVAYGAALAAFSFNSIVWLRILTVVSSLFYVLYYATYPSEPLWLDIITEGSLVIVNVVMLATLSIRNTTMKFTKEEDELKNGIFDRFSKFEFYKLMRLAKWRTAKPGEKLIVKGQEVTQLYLLYNGEASVFFDETYDVDLGDGRFLGELSFSLFEKAKTDITIKTKSRLVYWNQDDLWDLLERNPTMRVHFSELINEDLVRKMVM